MTFKNPQIDQEGSRVEPIVLNDHTARTVAFALLEAMVSIETELKHHAPNQKPRYESEKVLRSTLRQRMREYRGLYTLLPFEAMQDARKRLAIEKKMLLRLESDLRKSLEVKTKEGKCSNRRKCTS